MDRFRGALGESPPLWWSILYFFSLLTGYYVLRPVRDAMAASSDALAVFPRAWVDWARAHGHDIGDFTLQVLFTGTFLVMLALQPLYGALVARWPRRVFLPTVYCIFIAALATFYVLFHREIPGRGVTFFVWSAVFNLFAVTVFWSFMADVFDDTHAKRFYGYIGAGGTVGAMLGPMITRVLAERVGIANLMLVSIGFLCICLLCIYKLRPWALRREQLRGETTGERAMGGSVWAGFRLVWGEPLLRALAMLGFFGVMVGTLLYNEQAAIVRHAFGADATRATAYFANIDLAINLFAITVQLFVTRHLLRAFGVGPALLIPGFAVLLGFCALAASPFPMLVAVVQVATRGCEFALGKPGRETIYTRVPREWRYKAKAFIDTFVYRTSDVSTAWMHKALAGFGSQIVFTVGIGASLVFMFSAWRVVKLQRTLGDAPSPGDTRR
ncbi:putative inner membrane protein [Lysobacter dokdonensis DS-58]|uniref:Putative inner membrane protein n=1 Tax=Lysobacter dokdonensis DS-58 TaxID=1300345 RepID=A0A0A2WXS5_9GAMM|nr:MFS transporter [Lysobacter dokdonensis]KGQ17819.1 putative inner membrane protein [Lysobacter dokdonensis DS-58]